MWRDLRACPSCASDSSVNILIHELDKLRIPTAFTWYFSCKDWIRSICIFQVGSRLLRRTRRWGINACVKFVWTKRSPSCFYRVVIWFVVGIVLRPCASVQYVARLYAAQPGYLYPKSSRKTWLQHQFLHVLFWHSLQKLFADPGFPVNPKILTTPGWSKYNHINLNIHVSCSTRVLLRV